MRQQDGVYFAEIEPHFPPGSEYSRTEVDHQGASAAIQAKARMRARAGVEGVTGSDKGHAHRSNNL
jgi:hypothetical protein